MKAKPKQKAKPEDLSMQNTVSVSNPSTNQPTPLLCPPSHVFSLHQLQRNSLVDLAQSLSFIALSFTRLSSSLPGHPFLTS